MSNKYIYVPSYYKKFFCIADKCRHSCCVDWEIDIDETTLKKYKLEGKDICKSIEYSDGIAHFKLEKNGRCPHLNEMGLCNIISEYGDGFIPDICRLHPRFFNDLGTKIEAGLGLACEEACRIILENDEKFSIEKLGLSNEEIYESKNFSPIEIRDRIISVIEKKDNSFSEKIKILRAEFELEEIHSMEEWLDILLGYDILDEAWRGISISAKENKIVSESSEFDKYYERLLLYFVYRHLSLSVSFDNLRAVLAFCIFSAEIIKYIFDIGESKSKEHLFDIARLYSSEIEYSEDNTAELIFEFESLI